MTKHRLPFFLALSALAVAAAATPVSRPSSAEEGKGNHIVYMSVTGAGPNAKAWFRTAPPAGIPVQDALDQFSEQGYRVAEVRPYNRDSVNVYTGNDVGNRESTDREEYFLILLERPR